MAISLPIVSRTSSDPNTFQDVLVNDQQLVTEIDARDDNYQTLLFATGSLGQDAVAATYLLHSGSAATAAGSAVVYDNGSNVITTGVGVPPIHYFDDADYAVASKTQKLRVRAQVANNATAWSSVTATIGLYPVTVAGAADTVTFTLGTVVPGSSVAIANPSASTVNQANSGDFAIPSDGAYALGVVTSATLTNNACALVYGYLQTRWV